MKRINHILVLTLLLGVITSCSDDFINVANKEALTEESFWQTEEHALQALTAAYAALHSSSGSKWAFFEELYTAMSYRGDDIVNNTSEIYGRSLSNFTNTTEESAPYNVWLASYSGIGRANQIIERVPAMEGVEQESRDVIVSEAKFLRALYYFWLVTAFENVPLVTKFETNPDNLFPSQANASQVWSQIETDLSEAAASLPEAHEAQWVGRATKGAAQALLGKVYLFQEKWAEAETQLEGVVTSNQYTLLDNYADNFNGNAENGSESIFEIQFSGDRSNGNDERHPFNFEVSPYTFGGWELFYPSEWLVDEMKKDLNEDGEISERVYESIFFEDTNSDMYSLDAGTEIAYDDVAGELNHPKYFKKYSYNVDENFYVGTNISLIRYADVLLMYAEALNENGNTDQAIIEINKVRERGKAAPLSDMNQETLRQQIRHHERPVELSMEFGIRWFDLYRWQRGSVASESIKETLQEHNTPFVENFEDKHVVFPIPLQEININPNLKQNSGW